MRDTADAAAVAARLAALKGATMAAHARIETVPLLAALSLQAPTLQGYGAVLQRLHLHFARFEPGLFDCLAPHLPAQALQRRGSIAALRADLHDLGLEVPPVPALPGPSCPAEAAGWLYVHEGSSLGGLVILRRLRARLGPALGDATRHYRRHGRATAATWQETRRLIAGLLPDDPAQDRAIAGATQAFAALHRTMAGAPLGGCPFAAGLPVPR